MKDIGSRTENETDSILAHDIAENLESALEQFRSIYEDLEEKQKEEGMKKNVRLMGVSVFMIIQLLIIISGCSPEVIQVVPGKSIAGVELGMSIDQMVSILGEPDSVFSIEDMVKSGDIYKCDMGSGEYRKPTSEDLEDMPVMKLFFYSYPSLTIVIDKDGLVDRLSLGYSENVLVKDYPVIKFKYLTQNEYRSLGEASNIMRNTDTEMKLLSMAPQETVIEYYDCFYDKMGFAVGFVFDRTKEKKSEYYIAVNYIDVYNSRN